MNIRSTKIARCALVVAAVLLGADAAVAAAPEQEQGAAASYCTSSGGQSTIVHPFANTNANTKQWVRYGGTTEMCTFTATDGSTIHIFGSTLKSTLPTMAALAYYAQVPSTISGGNPSDGYCVQLGGTFNIGAPGSGSMWTTQAGVITTDMCMFADGSAIDPWGLLYHSAGIVRGVDLSTVLKFANPY
jgi:putative hemolysin